MLYTAGMQGYAFEDKTFTPGYLPGGRISLQAWNALIAKEPIIFGGFLADLDTQSYTFLSVSIGSIDGLAHILIISQVLDEISGG